MELGQSNWRELLERAHGLRRAAQNQLWHVPEIAIICDGLAQILHKERLRRNVAARARIGVAPFICDGRAHRAIPGRRLLHQRIDLRKSRRSLASHARGTIMACLSDDAP